MAGCTLGDSARPGEGAVMFITKASRAVCVCVCVVAWQGFAFKGNFYGAQ